MNSKGFVTKPFVRIIPSPKFDEFLSKLESVGSMPDSLQSYLYDLEHKDEPDIMSYKSEVTGKDIKLIKYFIEDNLTLDERSEEISTKPVPPPKSDKVPSDSDENPKPYCQAYPDNVRSLRIGDLEWISSYLDKQRNGGGDCLYLHELMEGSELIMPQNDVIERNPELEARCVKLRKDYSNKLYRDMTKNVDNVRQRLPEDTISYQLKTINSQLVAIIQFIFSVFAGFMFGFIGIEVMTGSLDFGFRLLLGVICGLIVALAEIYVLAKKLNEDMEMEENVQIGGPPVLPNQKLHAD